MRTAALLKPIRSAAAWSLFAIGDAISRPMLRFDWPWLYRPYNRIMGASADLHPGPWREPTQRHEIRRR